MSRIIATLGNPNCGKTTLFNALTGATQQVGNWPGVTVEKKIGTYQYQGDTYSLVDLPGIYLLGALDQGAEDERVARDYILSGEPQLIVNIIDGHNLERNLYLTCQLLEMRVPMVLVINMVDLAERNGIRIDCAALAAELGCPVVPMVASRGVGVDALKQVIAEQLASSPAVPILPALPSALAAAVTALSQAVREPAQQAGVQPDWVALKLLEGDGFAESLAAGRLDCDLAEQRAAVEAACGEDIDIVIADARYRFIARLMAAGFHQHQEISRSLTRRIDQIVLNRFLGVPVFLLAMYLMFLFTINIGGLFVDFLDQSMAALLVDGLGGGLETLGFPDWLIVMVQGVGRGLQTVSTFIPIIACLFLFLSFLEDSGYMARAAFVMDRAMRAIGLPGKSFVPLIVGFGCNVPAIMATRTLQSRRDRVLTALMAPFMSCGARLPVFALFAAAFFPTNGQNIVFALYLAGLGFAVLTGLLLKLTVLRGETSHFVMELPPYHIPTFRTVALQAWQRLREFIFNAGQVIVPIVMVLSFLSALGTDGSFGKENSRDSVLAVVSEAVMPVFAPMGLRADNWPAAVGLFSGVFAKEAVIGTLNTLYGQMAGVETDEATVSIPDKLQAALATVPANIVSLADKIVDPLGLDLSYIGDEDAAASQLSVAKGVFGAMIAHFDGVAGAFAYMLLILLYSPCVAALGAIRHEVGAGWALFAAGWNTVLGYGAAVITYQGLRFDRDPQQAILWLVGVMAALMLIAAALWWFGRRHPPSVSAAHPAE